MIRNILTLKTASSWQSWCHLVSVVVGWLGFRGVNKKSNAVIGQFCVGAPKTDLVVF